MSKESIVLEVEKRQETGKSVRALRRDGFVPLNMYERGKESQALKVQYMTVDKVYKKAGRHHAVEVILDGKKHLAMIKDVAIDPVKNTILHISMHAIKQNDVIEAEVPVRLEGLAPATTKGLLVRANIDTVTVKGIPASIPDEVVVDVTSIENEDDDIRASALSLPEKVELLTEPEVVVVTVVVPRAEVEKEQEEVTPAEVPTVGEAASEA